VPGTDVKACIPDCATLVIASGQDTDDALGDYMRATCDQVKEQEPVIACLHGCKHALGCGVAANGLGAEAQELDELAARAERVGDGVAAVDLDGGPQLLAHLGDQDVAGGRGGAVERCEPVQGDVVDIRSAADGESGVGHWVPLGFERFDLNRSIDESPHKFK
jgi:hypothetical protein